MSRHEIPELGINQEVPLVMYKGDRRVIVGRAVVLAEGIAAYFDGDVDDSYIKSIVNAITKGVVSGLSIAPTAADIPKQRERE
jgi:hypothetical protein